MLLFPFFSIISDSFFFLISAYWYLPFSFCYLIPHVCVLLSPFLSANRLNNSSQIIYKNSLILLYLCIFRSNKGNYHKVFKCGKVTYITSMIRMLTVLLSPVFGRKLINSLNKQTINLHLGFQSQRWAWFIIYEPCSGPISGTDGAKPWNECIILN